MIKNINIFLLSLISISISISISAFADDSEYVDEHRDRIHSVRAAVGSVVKTEDKEIDVVDGFRHMFEDGVVSGEIRSMYSSYNYDKSDNTYATAFGGQIKYELAEYKGFNAGIAFLTSYKIGALSGNDVNFNNELTSQKEDYTQLSEAYINYKYKDLNLRIGRQVVDTPLADSDDIRMTQNTFEAYMASYELDNFTAIAGVLRKFQGFDAGLDIDDTWQKTGADGTYLAGMTYIDDIIEANILYYDISADNNMNSTIGNVASKSIYASLGGHYHFNQNIFIHGDTQYLNQRETDSSSIESDVFGAMLELVVGDIGFNIAYNKSLKKESKQTFSGFGGGTLFTSMDNMILDNITADRDARGIVSGISYTMDTFNFLYAYGDFDGGSDSSGISEHIVEQNIGFEYKQNEELTMASIYTKQEDKKNTGINGGDWDNVRILVSYNF